MNFQYRRLSIKLKPTSWLLSFISITILTSVVKGLHSKTAEWANKNNQHVDSELTKTIRAFLSIRNSDDTDKRFQSLVDNYDQDQLLLKDYRLINSQFLISPFQITTPDEGYADGSGITAEETKSSSTSSTIILPQSSTSSSSTAEQTTSKISSSTTITTTTTSFPQITFTTPTLNFSNQTSFFLLFLLESGARVVDTQLPMPINRTEIEKVLQRVLNELYNQASVIIVPHNYTPYIIEYLVVLNISLNVTQRLKIVNEFFNPNISRDDSYKLIVRMVINDVTGKIENFTEAQRRCKECELLERGVCSTTSDTCICYPNFEGEFCRIGITTSKSPQLSSSSTNWTIIVAVISAILIFI